MKATLARVARLSIATSALLLTGCSILAPIPDTSHFFMLAPLADTSGQPAGSEPLQNLVLGLGPIKLPPYLDRNEIALRLSPTQVTYSETDRWAEPLNVTMSRVLLQDLSSLLGTNLIVRYPWSNAAKVDYQIEIELEQFEATKAGEAQLRARFGIIQGGTRTPLVVREASFNRPGATDTGASVTALSALLGDLSQEIASALRQLPKPPETKAATRRK